MAGENFRRGSENSNLGTMNSQNSPPESVRTFLQLSLAFVQRHRSNVREKHVAAFFPLDYVGQRIETEEIIRLSSYR